jgi:hypothetical protein
VPLGRLRGAATGPVVPPVENLVHLDRFGHQPFRAHARRPLPDMA